VVVVHPTVPVGPRDVKPTPTGQIIVDFLNGRMPAYVNTGLNLVSVEDVAIGHVLALEKGKAGERYILGNRNLTLSEMLQILGKISGIRPPSFRMPLWLAMAVARVDELVVARATGKPPRVPIAGVQAARKFRHFDCSRAISQIGMPQTPVEVALGRAVRWFRENGYAR
jgi:dihydroflavonol-4-reductase